MHFRQTKTPHEILEGVADRLVRRVAAEAMLEKTTPEADALFEIAKGEQTEWSAVEWQAVLDELDACQLTVGEYLAGVTPPTQEDLYQ